MKLGITITMIFLVTIICAVLWNTSRGHASLVIYDLTIPHELKTQAPVMPFRNGSLYVIVSGNIDGNATLEMESNHGRDKRHEVITGSFTNRQIGGPEEWVDDLTVRYVPGTATQGELLLEIYCGRNSK